MDLPIFVYNKLFTEKKQTNKQSLIKLSDLGLLCLSVFFCLINLVLLPKRAKSYKIVTCCRATAKTINSMIGQFFLHRQKDPVEIWIDMYTVAKNLAIKMSGCM